MLLRHNQGTSQKIEFNFLHAWMPYWFTVYLPITNTCVVDKDLVELAKLTIKDLVDTDSWFGIMRTIHLDLS